MIDLPEKRTAFVSHLTASSFLVATSQMPLVAFGCWQLAWFPGSEVLEPGLWLEAEGKAARLV